MREFSTLLLTGSAVIASVLGSSLLIETIRWYVRGGKDGEDHRPMGSRNQASHHGMTDEKSPLVDLRHAG